MDEPSEKDTAQQPARPRANDTDSHPSVALDAGADALADELSAKARLGPEPVPQAPLPADAPAEVAPKTGSPADAAHVAAEQSACRQASGGWQVFSWTD